MTDQEIFARLKTLPPWQEAVTRYRLDLIRGWEKLSRPRAKRKRNSSRMTKRQYCASRGMAYKTFLKWELRFKRKGIEGIIYKYGRRRMEKGIYKQEINWINSALLGPQRTVKDLHAELAGMCKAKKMRVPSPHTLRRILRHTDLRDLLVEGQGAKSWVKVDDSRGRIEIDLSRPMACIDRMERRLKSPQEAQILLRLMRLRLEKYVEGRRREELHFLTQHGQ